MSSMFKEIVLKELNKEQKDIIREINIGIIEHQNVFHEQPEELVISRLSFKQLINNPEEEESIKYLLLGKIKIYSV